MSFSRVRVSYLLTLLIAVLFTACASFTKEVDQSATQDAKVAASVKRALTESDTVDAAAIRVVVDENGVTLSGFVDSPSNKREAARVSLDASGYYSLVNELVVKEP